MKRPILASLAFLVPALVIVSFAIGGCGSFKRFMYSGFDRDEWQQPDRVVGLLGLEPGDQVADLGAGGGYFTFRLAEAVGEQGKVYAIDVDPEMLEYLDVTAAQKGLTQVFTLMAKESDPGLADDSVDLIFLSNTFHHLPDQAAYFRGAQPALREGARIAVVELRDNSFPVGSHYTDTDEIVRLMEEAGYRLVVAHEFLERQSFMIFGLADAPPASGDAK